jgi:acyl carrier protein
VELVQQQATQLRIVPPSTSCHWTIACNSALLPNKGILMKSIEERLYVVVASEFGLTAHEISKEVSLRDHGDSLDWFSLMMALEDAFGVEISDEVGKTLNTVGDLLEVVREGLPA